MTDAQQKRFDALKTKMRAVKDVKDKAKGKDLGKLSKAELILLVQDMNK